MVKKKEKTKIQSIKYVDEAKVNSAREKIQSDEIVEYLAETFSCLGDPTRTRIISVLLDQELCVGDLARLLNLSSSTVSHQLRILRNLRLVKHRHDGKNSYYCSDDIHIKNLFNEGLKHIMER